MKNQQILNTGFFFKTYNTDMGKVVKSGVAHTFMLFIIDDGDD